MDQYSWNKCQTNIHMFYANATYGDTCYCGTTRWGESPIGMASVKTIWSKPLNPKERRSKFKLLPGGKVGESKK